jgi:hypothetical protein
MCDVCDPCDMCDVCNSCDMLQSHKAESTNVVVGMVDGARTTINMPSYKRQTQGFEH